MDQQRLFLAIGLSIAILLGFQYLMPAPKHVVPPTTVAETAVPAQPGAALPGATQPGAMQPGATATGMTTPAAPPREAPRVGFVAPRVQGSVNLRGARIDDLVLRDYRETIDPASAKVRLLDPAGSEEPNFVQFGWTAADAAGVKVPDEETEWTASGDLVPGRTLNLTWDNGAGLTFGLALTIDDNYMFSVAQSVRNAGTAPVLLFPWSRVHRGYTPKTAGYYVLHEGLIGVFDGRLYDSNVFGVGNGDYTYAGVKSLEEKNKGAALDKKNTVGWAGITDKYWLAALVPDKAVPQNVAFRYVNVPGGAFQVDFTAADPETVAPAGTAAQTTRLFVGAKEVHLLDRYERQDGIVSFDKAVDFGLYYFITKPFFYAIDWLNGILGNFGLAILVFTIFIKGLFFPLANKSYRSMSKMKLLAPKMTVLREQYKDNQPELQKRMMELYRTEKVNPASGCLPIVIQIPVFFSLYKVIFVTIEMRQAPFFGWIHDLSAIDPTNVFNLFGLIPIDPAHYLPLLHLGAWPLIMGFTMFFQQKLNPPPPDPVQAKLFQFMPIIFTFMLASFPAGLVIYWSWNNLLTIGQQWLIMRQTHLAKPGMART